MLDEGLSATLRAQAVEDTLSWLVGQAEFAALLVGFTTGGLRRLLAFLLNQRLETQVALDNLSDANAILRSALQTAFTHLALAEPVAGLREMHSARQSGCGCGRQTGRADRRSARTLEQRLNRPFPRITWLRLPDCSSPPAGRRWAATSAANPASAKQLLGDLRKAYDERLDAWLGGGKSTDTPPDPQVEEQFLQSIPLIQAAFAHLLQAYQSALRQRQALDFDDLEAGAANLLKRAELRSFWQNEIDALLVDEFQDTNARQREIVLALCGETPGRLFVVGDARQSIYRFRRADVTVFRSLQQDIAAARRAGDRPRSDLPRPRRLCSRLPAICSPA